MVEGIVRLWAKMEEGTDHLDNGLKTIMVDRQGVVVCVRLRVTHGAWPWVGWTSFDASPVASSFRESNAVQTIEKYSPKMFVARTQL